MYELVLLTKERGTTKYLLIAIAYLLIVAAFLAVASLHNPISDNLFVGLVGGLALLSILANLGMSKAVRHIKRDPDYEAGFFGPLYLVVFYGSIGSALGLIINQSSF